jgi:signal peptide peptidase SppA
MIGSNLWVMDEFTVRRLVVAPHRRADALPKPSPAPAAARDTPYAVVGGVAIISLTGVLTKYSDVYARIFGGTSTKDTLGIFQDALKDSRVSAVLYYVDSPGGEVDGTSDLAEAIAASDKPVFAYISDCGASGAYWIASQCDKIYANTTASIGCIGVYRVLADTSKLYEQAGVSIKLVKAGAFKGVGEDGIAITDPQLADQQREVDEVYDVFVQAIADGRDMSLKDATAIATGQTWIASKAEELGLIDGIATFDDVLSKLTGNEMSKASVTTRTTKKTNVGMRTASKVSTQAVDPVKSAQEKAFAAAFAIGFNNGFNEAVAGERRRFAGIVKICDGDAAFALAQFRNGNDEATAATEFRAAKIAAVDLNSRSSPAMAKFVAAVTLPPRTKAK